MRFKHLFVMISTCLVLQPVVLLAKETKKESVVSNTSRQWFKGKTCQSLEIKNFTHAIDKKPAQSKTVNDQAMIQKIRGTIEALPTEGEKMKSLNDKVPRLALEFSCDQQKETIAFYQGRIQTPATSFYADPLEAESELYKLIKSLL